MLCGVCCCPFTLVAVVVTLQYIFAMNATLRLSVSPHSYRQRAVVWYIYNVGSLRGEGGSQLFCCGSANVKMRLKLKLGLPRAQHVRTIDRHKESPQRIATKDRLFKKTTPHTPKTQSLNRNPATRHTRTHTMFTPCALLNSSQVTHLLHWNVLQPRTRTVRGEAC